MDNQKQNDNYNRSFSIFLAMVVVSAAMRLLQMHGYGFGGDRPNGPADGAMPADTTRVDTVRNHRVTSAVLMDTLQRRR
ncbi:MAG: hypothetical protein K2L94_04595 [Alphaproteobacteria bacterium]|nr:hypothetical protein [Alphaproteobacteria bacterium]